MTRQYVAPPNRKRFGWIRPEDRTSSQTEAHEQCKSELIRTFGASGLSGQPVNKGDRYPLWKVFEALPGKKAPYVNQTTGSCVGAGGYNALMTLMMVEIVTKKEPEKWNLLWWPFTYEVSRSLAGFHSKGEGSLGTTWFKAIKDFGMPRADYPGLPKYQQRNGWLYLDESIELKWSYNPELRDEWDEEAMEHPIEGGLEVRSIEELDAALTSGYPCTIASGIWGTRSSEDLDGWMVAKWNDRWSHQQYIDEVVYPSSKTGKLYRIGNNWNETAHPRPTMGEPAGGYYVREKHMAKILEDKDCECFMLSDFTGIKEEPRDIWDTILNSLLEEIFSSPNRTLPDLPQIDDLSPLEKGTDHEDP